MSIPATGKNCQILSLAMLPKELQTDNFIKKYFNYDKDGSGVLESVNLNGDNEFDKLPQKLQDAVLPYTINGNVSVSGRINSVKENRNNVFSTTIFGEDGTQHSTITLNASHFEYREVGEKVKTYNYDGLSESQYAKLVRRRDNARAEIDAQERQQIREVALSHLRKTFPSGN